MFDIGWGELLVIGIVALVAIGPKELPGALRTLGQWMGKLRRMASEFQSQFQEAMREAEMADLKKQVDDLTSQAQSYTHFDPISDVRKEFESAQQQIEGAITATPPAEAASGSAATEAPAPSAAEPTIASPAAAPTPPAADAPIGAAAAPDDTAQNAAGGKSA